MNPLIDQLLSGPGIGYLLLSREWVIQNRSETMKLFSPHPEEVEVGRDVRLGFPELISLVKVFQGILTGQQESFEFRGIVRTLPPNTFQSIDLFALPYSDPINYEVKLLIIFQDVTETFKLKQVLIEHQQQFDIVLQKLYQTQTYLEQLVSSIGDALFVTSSSGIIQSINAVTEQLLGYQTSELIGRKIEEFFVTSRSKTLVTIGDSREIKKIERVLKTQEGKEMTMAFSCSKIMLDSEKTGWMYLGRDITEYKRSQIKMNQINTDLADQVEARTRELRQTIQQLEIEMAERKQIENILKEQINVKKKVKLSG